jgi:hypothetical protein
MTRPRVIYISLIVASVLVLLTGLLGAVLIYQAADNESRDASMYELGEGATYPVSPQDTKKYLRDMELYGGKANVLATELRLWLVGLWQGKSLAYMLAFIAILVSFALFYAASRLPRPSKRFNRNPSNNNP